MYTIANIIIDGLHGVSHEKIELSNFNYFFGKNGAGKTTILNAIQLALLGYIPGTAKSNSGIMKHTSKPTMYVECQLVDDAGQQLSVRRTWTAKGASVSCTTVLQPETLDLDAVVGELALPIFDFNEFMNQSANSLKDWFISILPESSVDADLRAEMDKVAQQYLDTCNLGEVKDTQTRILESDTKSILETLKYGCEVLKDAQSATKAKITSLQNTINTLVMYDDAAGCSAKALEAQLKDLKSEEIELSGRITTAIRRNALKSQIADKFSQLTADSFDTDEECNEASRKLSALQAQLSEMSNEATTLSTSIQQRTTEVSTISQLAHSNGVCPYTKAACESVNELIAKAKADFDAQYAHLKSMKDRLAHLNADIASKSAEITSVNKFLQDRRSAYLGRANALAALQETSDACTSDDIDAMNQRRAELQAESEKVLAKYEHAAANERFDALSGRLNADKAQAESSLAIYKLWSKLLGSSGLQTQVMTQPFVDLAAVITSYLQAFFNDESVVAEFTLAEKANSFNFGLRKGSSFISFETLSSGERCIYVLSLLIALIQTTNTQLPVMLIDDLLDHLDRDKALAVFSTLYNITGIQILLAGVQPCEHPAAPEFLKEL